MLVMPFSLHPHINKMQIYPHDYEAKDAIDLKVEVTSGIDTDTYLAKLAMALDQVQFMFHSLKITI